MAVRHDAVERHGKGTTLVVALHAFKAAPDSLRHVRDAVKEALPDADLLFPRLPAHTLSLADPADIAVEVAGLVRDAWNARVASHGSPYSDVVLVGHSIGALIVRKAFVVAGARGLAPDETVAGRAPMQWASNVSRVVLLAGTNRGWTISHHMQPLVALAAAVGVAVDAVLRLATGRATLAMHTHRGAPFVTQLRVEWIDMMRDSSLRTPLVVQLLGSIDDIVSPRDNVDLVAGREFVYLDVAASGHVDVVEMDSSPAGRERRRVFTLALTGTRDALAAESVLPVDDDQLPKPPRPEVTDVVFVVHGIRDEGYWTHKIARRIRSLARGSEGDGAARVIATETSSYGYFPMLPFLLPWTRRAKVEWLMDAYAENRAQYPNAAFSFVGHSNGTYLLAKAMEEYEFLRLRNVVFAGSVVQYGYAWDELMAAGRVGAVLNYEATADWVVAVFPNVFESLPVQDLGGAGHRGFRATRVDRVKYVVGAHSAALGEAHWDEIARFVLTGERPREARTGAGLAARQSLLVRCLGHLSPVVWLVLVAVVALGAIALARWPENAAVAATLVIAYLAAVWAIVTRF